jgi:transposase
LTVKGDKDLLIPLIQVEISESRDSLYVHRLHALLLVCKEWSCYKVAELYNHCPRTIERWVLRFNLEGLAGLKDLPHPGRPARIEDHIDEISGDLRKSPRDFGYDSNLWDGPMLSYHLEKRYSILLGVRQCQRFFHKIGFRLRKPRAVMSKSDPELEEEFKKILQV